MLESLAVATTSPSLTDDIDDIESRIMSMQAGDIRAYLIQAQSSAVVLPRGKLLCPYPGPAIAVPNSAVDNPTFPPELANFLTYMSYDVLDSAAMLTKNYKALQRETSHPRYITQLLTNILYAFGKPADIPRIRKRVADDVLQSNATLPMVVG
ncbi:hypothetical protein DFH29DRAFT_1034054 [Suillus ampliporus]|nr:hypothetical protein DFH29DRAFT_1034054 [Suillus ampliporus]